MKKTSDIFWTMVKRDLVIQIRDWPEFVFRVAMLPFVLILTYGYILPKIGILPSNFPQKMFPGMVGMSLLVTGIHGTAVPLSMDFNNSREIEDRLQAPVSVKITAFSKMLVGIIESWIGALLVLPISLVFMGQFININLSISKSFVLLLVILLSSITSATLGLLVGTIVKPMQIAAMFPGFLMPVIFSGAIFFSWNDLKPTPIIQYLYLINPLVYINEALRYLMVPEVKSMPFWISIIGILFFTIIMEQIGMKRFTKMANR